MASIEGENKCGRCGRTVYQVELIEGADKKWHKACFKCADESCGLTLNLKTFRAHQGEIFCARHVPMPSVTPVADSLHVAHQINAPKRVAEGLGVAHKGANE
eukprot:TRINITY_DN1271_c0_g1_i4.p1 TRINITY_DN1271_c0_g1~~TRINITY_DN1271_c0_g1_i4.p1  ORF type:complete len:102 (+),score=27.72 TRINITY_DN1271_c0_g1_i4:80-385(+)